METKTIKGELFFGAGYRFTRENAEELQDKLRRRGQIVEIVEGKLSGQGVRGKFENKDVYMIYTRSKRGGC